MYDSMVYQPSFIPICTSFGQYIRGWNPRSGYPPHVTLYFMGKRDAYGMAYLRDQYISVSRMPYVLTPVGVDVLSSASFGDQWGMEMLVSAPDCVRLAGDSNVWQLVVRFCEDEHLQRLQDDRRVWVSKYVSGYVAARERCLYKPHVKIGDIQQSTRFTISRLIAYANALRGYIGEHRPRVVLDANTLQPVGRAIGWHVLQNSENADVEKLLHACVARMVMFCDA